MRKTTGISLLLLIFLSLSLLIFSLLSYSGAQADARLSQKAADHTTEYYQMTDKANQILAFIDMQLCAEIKAVSADAQTEISDTSKTKQSSHDTSVLQNSWTQIGSLIHTGSDFSEKLSTEFPDIHFAYAENDAIPVLTFETNASEDAAQALQITLIFQQPETVSDPLYQITSWNVINTQDWTPDQSQNLLQISH